MYICIYAICTSLMKYMGTMHLLRSYFQSSPTYVGLLLPSKTSTAGRTEVPSDKDDKLLLPGGQPEGLGREGRDTEE